MTFADLAEHFEKHYLKPAEYVDGRKIEGVRSLVPAQAAVNALKQTSASDAFKVFPTAIFAAAVLRG